MNVSHLRRMLSHGKSGTFRPLKVGEEIEPADVAVYDSWVESPSETSVGQKCNEKDRIVRFEFDEKGPRHQ